MAANGKRRIVIMKMGTALPVVRREHGDFEDWIVAGMGVDGSEALVVDMQRHGARLPDPFEVSHAVITGSEAMVTDEPPGVDEARAWLSDALTRNVSILGICFGHQLLAHVFGGQVRDDPRGREIGAVTVEVLPEGRAHWLFSGVASASLMLHEAHSQSVFAIPERARWLARGRGGICQAMAYGSAVGVQFHPEFTAAVMHGYLDALEESLRVEGFDVRRLHEQVREDDVGHELLRRFAKSR